jgi:hypothetical protein
VGIPVCTNHKCSLRGQCFTYRQRPDPTGHRYVAYKGHTGQAGGCAGFVSILGQKVHEIRVLVEADFELLRMAKAKVIG